MRGFFCILSVCVWLLLTTAPAFAAEPNPAHSKAVNPASAAMGAERDRGKQTNSKPQIITDEKTNTVRIVIGGKDILVIDATGIRVNGDIGRIPVPGTAPKTQEPMGAQEASRASGAMGTDRATAGNKQSNSGTTPPGLNALHVTAPVHIAHLPVIDGLPAPDTNPRADGSARAVTRQQRGGDTQSDGGNNTKADHP